MARPLVSSQIKDLYTLCQRVDLPNRSADCTTLRKKNSAAVGVCGEEDDDDTALTCKEIANYANQVQQTCVRNGKIGGMFTVSASKRIIVFNSKDADD